MEYNKEIGNKKGRRLLGRTGPRDIQRREQVQQGSVPSQNDALLNELRNQIKDLTDKLTDRPAAPSQAAGPVVQEGLYTAEEFDAELNKQIEAAIKELDKTSAKKLEEKEEEVKQAKDYIKNIEKHKNRLESIIDDLRKDLKVAKESVFDKNKFDTELNKQLVKKVKEIEALAGAEIEELEDKVEKLREDVAAKERFAEKASKTINELDKKIHKLESELEAKESIIKTKDEAIELLKIRSIPEGEVFVDDPDRPEMEMVFVDPDEKDKEKLETHINIKEDVKKEALGDKVNKLKSLIGGLPK